MDDSQRLELIAEAVRYCQRVKSLGMPTSSYTKALREPIYFLWEKRNGSKIKIAKYRSKASLGLKYGKGELVYDHVIPFRYLQEKLLALESVTAPRLVEILSQLEAAIITKEENALLNAQGLSQAMPADWDGVDPLARYQAVGIELISNA